MLTLSGITFAYEAATAVFEGFDWRVARSEIWAILGPSGCGKSTLLLLVAGLLHPQTGSITVGETTLARPRPATGLILQEYGLLPWATVRANVELGLRIRKLYGPDGRHAPLGAQVPAEILQGRVDMWLARLDLAELANRYPGEISGGQRQRVAIARAMVLAPDLLLMDEPFSALDAPTRESLQQLTLRLCAEAGLTAVLVTHSIEEAAYVGQNILMLNAPPNRVAKVIPNPHESSESFRHSGAYQATCAELRGLMPTGSLAPGKDGTMLPAQGGSSPAPAPSRSREG